MNTYGEIAVVDYQQFLARLARCVHKLASDNCWIILWYAHQWYAECVSALQSAGFSVAPIPAIWKKGNLLGQSHAPDSNLGNSYEIFLYARKGSPKLRIPGRSNIFDFASLPEVRKIHPTERPIELMKEVLGTFATPDTAVLSPFLGSGNTLLAADELGMPCIGYELSEVYYNAFLARITSKFNN